MTDVQSQKTLNQTIIIDLLESTKREGIDKLTTYLIASGFFNSPASTRFHGCYADGLAQHSLRVYELLSELHRENDFNKTTGYGLVTLPVKEENIIIATLLHDVCKIGAYNGTEMPNKWNRAQPKGHALLSLIRINQLIKLKPIEELMIKYHMGIYGLFEYDPGKGEFPLRSDGTGSKEERYGKSLRNAWYHNSIVKFMYFCDEMSTREDRP